MPDVTTAQEPIAVHLHEVLKRYAKTKKAALDHVSLEVRPGELLALLGPSGSGKTTLLNVLAGLESVSSGRVLLGDDDVTSLPPERRGVGVVFQSSMLYPHLSLRSSIGFAPRLAKVDAEEISRRTDEVTAWLNIQHLMDRKPGEVSGGERQRAAIAKALVTQPRLLLMDEPFSAVDAQLRRQLRTELVKLHRRIRTTTVFVTHDQEEAMSIADRVVVMREGEIVQVGTPLELYRQPVSSWLADFVSTQPINLFQAHVDHTGRAVLLPETLIVPDGVGLPAGTSFTAGVRPEHLSLHPSVSAPWQVLTQEMLGSLIKYILQDVHGNEVTAVSTTDAAVDPGATVALHVDAPRCLTFDRESGQALTASLDGVPVVS